MKYKYLLILTFAIISQIGFAGTSVPIKEQVANVASDNRQLHQDLDELSADVEKLSGQLKEAQSTIDEHNFYYIEEYYDRISHLLTILGIIIAVVSIGFPFLINRQHDKAMDRKFDEASDKVAKASEDAVAASKDAAEAKDSLKEIEKLRNELNKLREEIKEDKEESKKAAKRAKVSELISQSNKETDHGKSIELLTQAILLDPECFVAYYNRGVDKSVLGDKKGAIEDYDSAIELRPNYAYAYNNKAYCLNDLKRYEEALTSVTKSLALEKTDAALDTRGVIYTNLSRFDEAKKDLDEAIKMNSNYTESYEHRAALYQKMAYMEEDAGKREDLIKLAEADEAKAKELKK